MSNTLIILSAVALVLFCLIVFFAIREFLKLRREELSYVFKVATLDIKGIYIPKKTFEYKKIEVRGNYLESPKYTGRLCIQEVIRVVLLVLPILNERSKT